MKEPPASAVGQLKRAHTLRIGRLCVRWAKLEFLLDYAIYLAFDTNNPRDIGVKEIPRSMESKVEAIKKFYRLLPPFIPHRATGESLVRRINEISGIRNTLIHGNVLKYLSTGDVAVVRHKMGPQNIKSDLQVIRLRTVESVIKEIETLQGKWLTHLDQIYPPAENFLEYLLQSDSKFFEHVEGANRRISRIERASQPYRPKALRKPRRK